MRSAVSANAYISASLLVDDISLNKRQVAVLLWWWWGEMQRGTFSGLGVTRSRAPKKLQQKKYQHILIIYTNIHMSENSVSNVL